ncbi:MAG: O-acetyl-ADP-ribose deacetylase [Flavisolibacter sp.]
MNDKIQIVKGDITKIRAEAIVNAANPTLMGGGGVDGAIHQAAGPSIKEECEQIIKNQGPCKTGNAVMTSAGNLPATYIIHTVGPIWRQGINNENDLLWACYQNCLVLAGEKKCRTIAFPNISTGIYGFPKKQAARISLESIRSHLSRFALPEMVFLVCYDDENYQCLLEAVRSGT